MDSTERLKADRYDSVERFLEQGGESWGAYQEWLDEEVNDDEYELTARSESTFYQLKDIIEE